MQATSALRSALLSTLGASIHSHSAEQELYEQLMAHKHVLLNLFNAGRRSPEQQRAVESGKIAILGKAMAVNQDFSRQVIFLSQQLDCSEQYVAELLHDVMLSHPNLVGERCVETTILEHHTRRRHVAECLKLIFEGALAAQSPGASSLHHRLEHFARQQLVSRDGGGSSLAETILKEVDRVDESLIKVSNEIQNAGSATVAPSSGPLGARLGYDLLNAIHRSLEHERSTLATTVFIIGRLGFLSTIEISRIVDWLRINPHHPLSLYYLPAVLVAFDIVDPQSFGAQSRRLIVADAAFISQTSAKLSVDPQWSEPGLKAVILLKWTIFLTEMRYRDPSLEEKEGFKSEQLEAGIWNAIQGDCFPYFTNIVLHLHRGSDRPLPASLALGSTQDNDVQGDLPPADVVISILDALEGVVRSLITHASSELRKIKQRQEDLLLAGARAEQGKSRGWRSTTAQPHPRHASGPDPSNDKKGLRNDIASMFAFVGLLYSALPPDRALPYWGARAITKSYLDHLESTVRRLPSFLQWAIWSTQPHDFIMLTALYDMLTGLANGERCSELAYNFMVGGAADGAVVNPAPSMSTTQVTSGPAVSWHSMFSLLESWAVTASTPRPNPPGSFGGPGSAPGMWHGLGISQHHAHQSQSRMSLTQQDVLLAQSFLHLLSTVVQHSIAVRVNLSGHPRFRAIPILVSLIPLNIPLELKGTLFDSLSSFCQPGADGPGLEICKTVWSLMERLEVINVRGSHVGGPPVASAKGVEVELEEVESVFKVYPATIAFVKLLSTLIHTPKSVPSQDPLTHQSVVTIPEGLGHPYRSPGIGPYSAFVIDNVFSNISRREYLMPSDRWKTNDACLSFIERCLASFDLESLAGNQEAPPKKDNDVLQMVSHPGYEIMKRLLTQSVLQANILSYIVEGINGFDGGLAEEQPYFRRTIIRVLRIIYRALELQDLFLDVLIPLLSDMGDRPFLGDVHPASYFVKLTQTLFFTPEYISAIATYVAYPAHIEARLLALKIISILATPPTVSQLAVMIDRSSDSERILSGFLSIMDAETWVDVEDAEAAADQFTGAGAPDQLASGEAIAQFIKLILLEFLSRNASSELPYPNIAHYILFGQVEAQNQIRDPGALNGQRSCIHSLLNMMNRGISKPVPSSESRSIQLSEDSLLVVLPGLAERCYEVIHKLCRHPSTTEFVSRYLRSRENFFARHLRAIPCKAPSTAHQPFVELVYQDGSRVCTSVSALCSFLRLRSCVLSLIALELHALVAKGQQKDVAELLAILFEQEGDSPGAGGAALHNNMFKPFREVGQTQSKMIELLQRLDFDWSDSLAVGPTELQFLSQLNLQSCVCLDRFGCEVVDRGALLLLLSEAKQALHAQGHIANPSQADQLSQELSYVLQSCAVENHRRQVQHAVSTNYDAWGSTLNVALTECFSRIPIERQENILLDLLHALSSSLQSANISLSATIIVAEGLVTTITKIRGALLAASHSQGLRADLLPPERLHTFLRSLLGSLVHASRSQLVRGNLYACLIHYLHLAMLTDYGTDSRRSLTDANGDIGDIGDIVDDGLVRANSSLVAGTTELIRPFGERLAGIVSRDASDGAEVWRTVALLLLDALVQFSHKRFSLLPALSRPGHLSRFVKSLGETDLRLQAVLKPDCDDLNALYAYEAKMSLFNRIVQNKAGAEQLLDTQILKVLSKCDFLDASPEIEYDSAGGSNDYLPPVVQRYHQLLTPALQLACGIMLSLGSEHSSAARQTLDFLYSHADVFILLLRNSTTGLSLRSIDELHFLICSCATILRHAPPTELHTSSGYGAIHSAILNFSARFLSSLATVNENVANQDAPGRRFHLLRSILLYLEAISDITDSKNLLSPSLNITQGDSRIAHISSLGPTIGDILETLDLLSNQIVDSSRYEQSSPHDTDALALAVGDESSSASILPELFDCLETTSILLGKQLKVPALGSETIYENTSSKVKNTLQELLSLGAEYNVTHWQHFVQTVQIILSSLYQ